MFVVRRCSMNFRILMLLFFRFCFAGEHQVSIVNNEIARHHRMRCVGKVGK